MKTTNSETLQDHLIIVCGHSVYTGTDTSDWKNQANWIPGRDDPALYARHIRAGIQLAGWDKQSLLVFSGGQTREEAGPRSEALSYWMVAKHLNLWHSCPEVEKRVALEEFARTSLENLLFGICRFKEWVGGWPKKISVVSFEVKCTRFEVLHNLIGWNGEKHEYKFYGPNNPDDPTAKDHENANLKKISETSLVDVEPPSKRRDPFKRKPPYSLSCPEPFEGFKGDNAIWKCLLERPPS